MIKKCSQLKNLAVIQSDGNYLCAINRAIIDPSSGKILAFILRHQLPNILSPLDIKNWHGDHVNLSPNYELHRAEEIIRLSNINHKDLLGRKVKTESGLMIGRVTDYSIDTEANRLYQIQVQKLLAGVFPYSMRLINFSQIIEITKSFIIVKDSFLRSFQTQTEKITSQRALSA